MRVLVTGAAGLLAASVVREFQRPSDGHDGAEVIALGRAALDITDAAAVGAAIEGARPDVVINCAAYNNVDGAEDDAQTALRVNALGVLALGAAAQRAGAGFVHYGTDFVFDGESTRPYNEQDRTNPRSVYGSSKLLGDWLALEHPGAYVLRVESLFGLPASGGTRLGSVGTILNRMKRGERVPVFVDRTVSPTYTADIARATRELLERGAPVGLYHCVNGGAATWEAVAEEMARLLELSPHVDPITVETARLRVARPRYCALSNAKLAGAGIVMPSWQDALRRFLLQDGGAAASS